MQRRWQRRSRGSARRRWCLPPLAASVAAAGIGLGKPFRRPGRRPSTCFALPPPFLTGWSAGRLPTSAVLQTLARLMTMLTVPPLSRQTKALQPTMRLAAAEARLTWILLQLGLMMVSIRTGTVLMAVIRPDDAHSCVVLRSLLGAA